MTPNRSVKNFERPRAESEAHWLGEGIDGQESLFVELDPYLYRADRNLCQVIKFFFYELKDSGGLSSDKPWALLCPAPDAVGWHVGVLAEFFQVSILAPERDELREQVAHRFHAELLDSGIPQGREGLYQLLVHTDTEWEDLERFRASVRFARNAIAPDGRCSFVLRGEIRDEVASIQWGDGSVTELADLTEGRIFLLPTPVMSASLSLPEISPDNDEYLQAFLKRHRDYFGRAARGACLARMADDDFRQAFACEAGAYQAAFLLVWDAEYSSDEKLR
ncbi:MAG: hypothetical protein U0136_02290 [Bdellovibrionota bacterium]